MKMQPYGFQAAIESNPWLSQATKEPHYTTPPSGGWSSTTTYTTYKDQPPRSQYVHWRMVRDGEVMLRVGVTFKMQWMSTSESWKVSIAACHTTDTWCRKKGAAIATIKMIDGEWFKIESPFRDARTDLMFFVNELFMNNAPHRIPPGVLSTLKKVWKS